MKQALSFFSTFYFIQERNRKEGGRRSEEKREFVVHSTKAYFAALFHIKMLREGENKTESSNRCALERFLFFYMHLKSIINFPLIFLQYEISTHTHTHKNAYIFPLTSIPFYSFHSMQNEIVKLVDNKCF